MNTTLLTRIAVAVMTLHIVDDSFLQPASDTGAGDHLVSALVPLAAFAVVAWRSRGCAPAPRRP